MNGEERKQQPLMFTVSEYKELNSISSLILVGKNIERVNFPEMVKQFDPEQDTDLDVMCKFASDYYETVLQTNNVEKMSKHFMFTTSDFMDYYIDKMIEIVANPKELTNYLHKPIEDVDRFRRVIHLCMDLYNATRVLVYNESDVHTVSLMTIMHMIGMVNTRDEHLNYNLLKIIGRYNETKSSDVDDWLETLEYDYELFHQKNILNSVVDLLSLSPAMVLDLIVYRLLVSPDFGAVCDVNNLVNDEKGTILDKLDPAVDVLMASAIRNIETIASIMNDNKFGISDYFAELFDDELGNLDHYNVKSEVVEFETELGCEENAETVKFKVKQYKPHVEEMALRRHLKFVLYDYLSSGNYVSEY